MTGFFGFLILLSTIPIDDRSKASAIPIKDRVKTWRDMYLGVRPKVFLIRCGVKQGAGFLFRNQKTILTSLSVAGCGRKIWLYQFGKKKPHRVRLKAYISRYDIALLESPKKILQQPFKPSSLGAKVKRCGVALLGHPFHSKEGNLRFFNNDLNWSLNLGTLGRTTSKYMQVAFSQLRGYVGSPLLDRQGRVMGMLTNLGPNGKPSGIVMGLKILKKLFVKKNPPRKGVPSFSVEFHFDSRFSFALGDAEKTSISPNSQEIRLDFILRDQWAIGLHLGLGFISSGLGLQASILPGVTTEYRMLTSPWWHPYLKYISLEGAVIFSFLTIDTSGIEKKEGTLYDTLKLSADFRASILLGFRFTTFVGRFSLGVIVDPTNFKNPVISFSWGI